MKFRANSEWNIGALFLNKWNVRVWLRATPVFMLSIARFLTVWKRAASHFCSCTRFLSWRKSEINSGTHSYTFIHMRAHTHEHTFIIMWYSLSFLLCLPLSYTIHNPPPLCTLKWQWQFPTFFSSRHFGSITDCRHFKRSAQAKVYYPIDSQRQNPTPEKRADKSASRPKVNRELPVWISVTPAFPVCNTQDIANIFPKKQLNTSKNSLPCTMTSLLEKYNNGMTKESTWHRKTHDIRKQIR